MDGWIDTATDPYELAGIQRRIVDGEREWHESFNAMTEEEREWFLADIALSDPERKGGYQVSDDDEIQF